MPILGAPFSVYMPACMALIALAVFFKLYSKLLLLVGMEQFHDTTTLHDPVSASATVLIGECLSYGHCADWSVLQALVDEGRILARRSIQHELSPLCVPTKDADSPAAAVNESESKASGSKGKGWFRGKTNATDQNQSELTMVSLSEQDQTCQTAVPNHDSSLIGRLWRAPLFNGNEPISSTATSEATRGTINNPEYKWQLL